MDVYKKAVQLAVRIETPKGHLSAEQLFQLSINELDDLAVKLEEAYKGSAKKSFVQKKSEKSDLAKLKFDLVLDVLNTKVEIMDAAAQKAENEAHNEKIMQLIVEKKDEELKGKSVKDLTKMLR